MTDSTPSVLLVDDVEANLVALEASLAELPCELVRATSGNDALKALLKRDFAVMLLDVQMPEIDGFEVAGYARRHPATRELPIIFLTAMNESEVARQRGYGSGAVDFLQKPFSAYVLRSKVRVFLDLYAQRRRLADEVRAHEKTLEALTLANTALRHFTTAASHDLRAPLRSLRGFLDIVSESAAEQLDAKNRDSLARAVRAAQRMDSLLSSLLIYARLQKPPAHETLSCDALLVQVRNDVDALLEGTGGELDVAPLPVVIGDGDRLYQVFLNLIGNAIKFRRPGQPPRVSVSAQQQGELIMFCVADDGIGIALRDQANIFNAFQRVHAVSTYEGTGLGLMISRQIVEQHGGRIWVESSPGEGSRFCFTLKRSA